MRSANWPSVSKKSLMTPSSPSRKAVRTSASLGIRSGSMTTIVLGFYVFDNVKVHSIQAFNA